MVFSFDSSCKNNYKASSTQRDIPKKFCECFQSKKVGIIKGPEERCRAG